MDLQFGERPVGDAVARSILKRFVKTPKSINPITDRRFGMPKQIGQAGAGLRVPHHDVVFLAVGVGTVIIAIKARVPVPMSEQSGAGCTEINACVAAAEPNFGVNADFELSQSFVVA